MRLPLKSLITTLCAGWLSTVQAADTLNVSISYLAHQPIQPPVLSNVLPPPKNNGLAGAELAINDSNSTGKFLKQRYGLNSFTSTDLAPVLAQAKDYYQQGERLFVVNMPSASLQQLSKQLPADALIFNAGSPDDQLRSQQCLSNVLHTLPSNAMLADALGQWLSAKRLKNWLLISGGQPADLAYRDALKRTAKRTGAKIVLEKQWSFDTDLRRSAQKELPLFTQGADYDVVLVADERGDFGEYVLFNTWLPRPVAGTQGLKPVAWHRVVEQWGAAQLQSRFSDKQQRWMTSKDYAAWAAVRSIAEAVIRTRSNSSQQVRDYLLSDQFQLAAFKGRKLSYRNWNGQLRQPIPLVHPRALVSQSPQEGFLHPVTDLDSLGFDKPESQCQLADA